MIYKKEILNSASCIAEISIFTPEGTNIQQKSVSEYNIILYPALPGSDPVTEALSIKNALGELLKIIDRDNKTFITSGRFFIRDRETLAGTDICLNDALFSFPISVIQQVPLNGVSMALWVSLQTKNFEDHEYSKTKNHLLFTRNGYTHIYTAGQSVNAGDPGEQTAELLDEYGEALRLHGCTLRDNCIRTWFFIKDIDNNYKEFADKRKCFFNNEGLTSSTHFIASTGIQGENRHEHSCITMDAYAIKGVNERQIQYLHALSHMSSTFGYGVTFERGTVVKYGDREHVFISGTASIDNKGEVMHTGDIVAQTYRMWENVEVLLSEAEASFSGIAYIIVYLRNNSDYKIVKHMFDNKFKGIPKIITQASVCRPTWLIEMECLVITSTSHNDFQNF
jgi:enamine deaminase RidA (YjgF/YER057c/UK114 family)